MKNPLHTLKLTVSVTPAQTNSHVAPLFPLLSLTHTWRKTKAEHVLCISVCARAAGSQRVMVVEETKSERREFRRDKQKVK